MSERKEMGPRAGERVWRDHFASPATAELSEGKSTATGGSWVPSLFHVTHA